MVTMLNKKDDDGVALHSIAHPTGGARSMQQELDLINQLRAQNYPSKFRRWFEGEFHRLPQENDAISELIYRAWIDGYNCCFKEHTE